MTNNILEFKLLNRKDLNAWPFFACVLSFTPVNYCLLMHICASRVLWSQLFCSDHRKQFSCLAPAQAKQKNNFFMIHPSCCSSSPGYQIVSFPLIWFRWQTIALWLTSTRCKGLVQMSRDVYYKGFGLRCVREFRPLAASTVRVCLRALTQGAGVCL